LRALRPDRIEVSDRTTLRWLGKWASRHDVYSAMVSHESLDGLLRLFGPGSSRRISDILNARTAADHNRIICTTQWAAREFDRIGARNVVRVPLGVDLADFSAANRSPEMRRRWAADDDVLLLHCGRLSPEKKPRRGWNRRPPLVSSSNLDEFGLDRHRNSSRFAVKPAPRPPARPGLG
jgi:alpha-1,6-mannosyltransferase